VSAAYPAKDGLSGPPRALEGRAGLFPLERRGEVVPLRLLDGFCQRWEILNYGFKPFPPVAAAATAPSISAYN
jgi:2-methylcitrate dehydratase PrpD